MLNVHLEFLKWKIDEYKNNPENSSTTKVREYILSEFPMLTIPCIKNNHDSCRGKGYMEIFCESLREHPMEITNFTRKVLSD